MKTLINRCFTAISAGLMALFVCAALCGALSVSQAWAASTGDDVRLARVGGTNNVAVAVESHEANVVSLSLALDVSIMGNDANSVSVGFDFANNDVLGNAKIKESTFDGKRLNIYVAGATNMFAENVLDLGNVVVSASGGDESASVQISVPDEGALHFVKEGATATYEEQVSTTLNPPTPVTIQFGATPTLENPDTTNNVGGAGGSTLAATGDQLMAIILVLVAVAAAAAIVALVAKNRSKKKTQE